MATRDHWGREIGSFLGVADMARMMKASTNPIPHKKHEEKHEAIEKLYSAINEVAKAIDENAAAELEQAEQLTKELIDFAKDFKKNSKKDTREERREEVQSKHMQKMADAMSNLWKASQSQNTVWVGISKLSQRAQNHIANAIRSSGCCGISRDKISKSPSRVSKSNAQSIDAAAQSTLRRSHTSGDVGRYSGGGNRGRSGGDGGDFEGDNPSRMGGLIHSATMALIKVHHDFVKAFDVDIGKTFDGVVVDSNKFRESLRAIVHEQQGFGKINRDIEESYRNITNQVYASGVTRAEFQSIYLKNLERGLSLEKASDRLAAKGLKLEKQEAAILQARIKRTLSIQTSALNTANALHMSADSMNDLFMNWHMHIGLSALELGEMGRHMQHISRTTGLTGAQLEAAMKSAEGIVKNLKNAGAASVDAVKKVTSFMAAAQKHGFDAASDIMAALTTSHGFLESKQRLFLLQVAQESNNANQLVHDLMSGRVLESRTSMKDLATGMDNRIRSMFSGFEGIINRVGFQSKDINASNISDVLIALRKQENDPEANMVVRALERQFKNLGIEPGQIEQFRKTLEESLKTPIEKLEGYQQDLQKLADKGLQGTDEFKRVLSLVHETQSNISMDAIGHFMKFSDEISKNNGLTEDLTKKIASDMSDIFGSQEKAQEWLKSMPAHVDKMMATISQRAQVAGSDFDEMLKRRGFNSQQDMAKAILGGNESAAIHLQEIMQEIQRNEKATEDPMTDIRRQLIDANTKLGEIADNISFGLSSLQVKVAWSAGYIADVLLKIAAAYTTFSMMRNAGGSLFGPRGGGVPPMMPRGGGGAPMMPNAPRAGGPPPLPTGGRGRFGRGRFARGLSFLGRHRGKLMTGAGALAGAGIGYYASDGDLTSTVTGGLIGGGLGYGGHRLLGRRGAAAAAGGAAAMGADMAGMPGWGQSCVPVCIVGGLESLSQGLGAASAMGVGLDMLDMASMADDVRTLTKGADKVDDAAKLAGAAADKVDDVAKAGRFGKFMNKIPGASKVGGFLGKAGGFLGTTGKYLGPAGLAATAMMGAYEAESAGRSTIGGAALSTLTGSAHTGSSMSGLVGIQKGSAADEGLGILGSAAYGAALGSFVPGVGNLAGAGIGAGIGLGVELVKIFTAEESSIRDAVGGFVSEMWETTKILGSNALEAGKSLLSSTYEAGKNLLSSAYDASSQLVSGVGSMLSSAGSGIKSMGSAAMSTAGAALSAMNPFNWFEEGTRSVDQGGLAVLHRGEMIIPQTIWEKIKAVGSGAFGAGKDVIDSFRGAASSLWSKLFNTDETSTSITKNKSSLSGSIISALSETSEKVTKRASAGLNYLSMGLFSPETVKDAQDSHSTQMKRLSGGTDLNDVISTVVETKNRMRDSSHEKNIVAEVSRALDYERTASEIAAESSTNMLDYRDEMRGEIGTLGLSRVAMESAVEKAKYGSQPSGGTAVLPSMDAIADYLITTQADKLDQMIEHLAAIRQNTNGQSYSQIISKSSDGAVPTSRPGVKNISRDMTRGFWDLTYGDYSTGTITTEGRGGSG